MDNGWNNLKLKNLCVFLHIYVLSLRQTCTLKLFLNFFKQVSLSSLFLRLLSHLLLVPFSSMSLKVFKEITGCVSIIIYTVGTRLTKVPERFLVVKEESVASLSCEAFSYPPSVITWKRPVATLPKGRSSVINGTLTIQNFSVGDTGTYICTAANKLGLATAWTTLGFQRKPGG